MLRFLRSSCAVESLQRVGTAVTAGLCTSIGDLMYGNCNLIIGLN